MKAFFVVLVLVVVATATVRAETLQELYSPFYVWEGRTVRGTATFKEFPNETSQEVPAVLYQRVLTNGWAKGEIIIQALIPGKKTHFLPRWVVFVCDSSSASANAAVSGGFGFYLNFPVSKPWSEWGGNTSIMLDMFKVADKEYLGVVVVSDPFAVKTAPSIAAKKSVATTWGALKR